MSELDYPPQYETLSRLADQLEVLVLLLQPISLVGCAEAGDGFLDEGSEELTEAGRELSRRIADLSGERWKEWQELYFAHSRRGEPEWFPLLGEAYWTWALAAGVATALYNDDTTTVPGTQCALGLLNVVRALDARVRVPLAEAAREKIPETAIVKETADV